MINLCAADLWASLEVGPLIGSVPAKQNEPGQRSGRGAPTPPKTRVTFIACRVLPSGQRTMGCCGKFEHKAFHKSDVSVGRERFSKTDHVVVVQNARGWCWVFIQIEHAQFCQIFLTNKEYSRQVIVP